MKSPSVVRLAALHFLILGTLLIPERSHAQSTLIPLTTRRAMVFDHAGKYLYVSTSDGYIRRYNLAGSQIDQSYNLGGSLYGVDIAPDDSFLLVAQNNLSGSQGIFQKLDLGTGGITNIAYDCQSMEIGAWDVAIGSNGLALVTTQFNGSGPIPLRQIDLSTNVASIRTDLPGSDVSQSTRIYRSADRARFYLMEPNSSNGPVFTYGAGTNTFGPSAWVGDFLDYSSGAVNRNGTLLATRLGNTLSLDTAPDFGYRYNFDGLDGGVAFDAVNDVLYAVDSSADQIIAYNTNTFAEVFRFNIGESINPTLSQFAENYLLASQDGRYLALSTASGVRIFTIGTGSGPSPTPNPTLATHRGMVFDHAGKYLYLSTSTGYIERFDLSTSQLETVGNLGGSLNGIDISPDDSFLLVAQNETGVSEGTFHKVDLATGEITAIPYTRSFGEAGGWDVAIASNGLALVTTAVPTNASGLTPLRQIDLATNTVSVRTDAPGSGGSGTGLVTDHSFIYRSADGSRLYILESDISNGPVFTYDANANSFSPPAYTYHYAEDGSAAVNRNGTLLGTRIAGLALTIDTAPDCNFLYSFNGIDSGVAFDGAKDLLYAVNTIADAIIAYDTNTGLEKFRIPIGQYISSFGIAFGNGTLIASPDGLHVALGTDSNVLLFNVPQNPAPDPTPTPSITDRRGMVFDHAGKYLYITTSGGFVLPYNLATNSYDLPYFLGGSLTGVDISPDDSFLVVAQGNAGLRQGLFYRLELGSGNVTNIPYTAVATLVGKEGPGWNVTISGNGLAFVTTGMLRQIDLSNNAISLVDGRQVVRIERNADYSALYFLGEGVFTYNSNTGGFSASANFGGSPYTTSAAVSRNGSRLATEVTPYIGVSVDSASDFTFLRSLGNVGGGIAFNAVEDTLYGINSAADAIIAYDTNTFAEKFRINIGETIGSGASEFGTGSLISSSDGRYLALETDSGFRLFDLTTVTRISPPAPTLNSPRGMVFNHAGNLLYITSSDGWIWPYNIASDTLGQPINLGGTLNGLDIAPDDSYLLVAQGNTGLTQGALQKVDLATGFVSNINYTLEGDSGTTGVAIASNNTAFITSGFFGSGGLLPLRQIDLATNAVSERGDVPGNNTFNSIQQDTQIYRSADRARLFFLAPDSSGFTYSVSTNAFSTSNNFIPFQYFGSTGGINRDGSLLGFQNNYNSTVSLINPQDFSTEYTFNGIAGGIAFDQTKDVLYAVTTNSQIVAYDTNTFAEKFRTSVGENVSQGPSPLVSSQDGSHLALITPTAVRVYDTINPPPPTPTPTPTPTTCTVSTSVSPTGSGTASGSGTFAYGSTRSVVASGKKKYSFTNWTENGKIVSNVATYIFQLTANRNLIANFTNQPVTVTVSASPAVGGTAVGTGTYGSGSAVTVTAVPNAGYSFTNWTKSGAVVSTSAAYTFTPTSSTSLVANFLLTNPAYYTVTTSCFPSAGTTSGGGSFIQQSIVTVSAAPNSGYIFYEWLENNSVVSSTSSYTFTLNGNRSLIAVFRSGYTVTTSSSPANGGTTTGGGAFPSNYPITVTATANSGFAFLNWTENGSVVSTSSSYSPPENVNHTLVANFVAVPNYTIVVAASPSKDGTVSGSGTFASGTSHTVTATPKKKFKFTSWTENGSVVSTSGSYTFTLTGNRNLVANFH